ncbi:hypothetical protein BP5796_06065 [Coleophoma crateriformis]|uniref:Uncharacterized protein n=1 Tax=Coleophoma crateriformis TaxID=565419 RepID=A0A3D8RVY4_9HELO|nr:hypothetical protein BP5796_06065 [Coleophoma crateriformis]
MPPKKSTKQKVPKTTPVGNATSSSPAPPAPFNRPNSQLEPLIEKISKRHVYITHVDAKPANFKYKIFSVPVVMNVVIVLGILWRIKTIGPFYLDICYSMMGKYNETTIDTDNLPTSETVSIILRRAGIFMIDLLIYVFIWPWPRDFFVGRRNGQFDNPIAWRYGVGFRDTEIVIRRSRKWDVIVREPINDEHEGTKELFENLRAAMDPIWLSEKTGYLLLNKWWDLDWNMMVEATQLVDKKVIPLDELKGTVLLHTQDFGWVSIETSSARGTAKEEEGRRKIIAFKDELTVMGKENLFFKWIELVQYESSKPGGFGPAEQAATMAKAKIMFEQQGVDFDQFWAKIGGMEGMPGMD